MAIWAIWLVASTFCMVDPSKNPNREPQAMAANGLDTDWAARWPPGPPGRPQKPPPRPPPPPPPPRLVSPHGSLRGLAAVLPLARLVRPASVAETSPRPAWQGPALRGAARAPEVRGGTAVSSPLRPPRPPRPTALRRPPPAPPP